MSDEYAREEAEDLPATSRLALGVLAGHDGMKRTRFQKLSLLVGDVLGLRDEIEPEPYFFGPFSETMTESLDDLFEGGLVEEASYKPTNYGKAVFQEVQNLDDSWTDALDVMAALGDLSDSEITSMIYDLYPELTSKSTIKETVTNRARYTYENLGSLSKKKIVPIQVGGETIQFHLVPKGTTVQARQAGS